MRTLRRASVMTLLGGALLLPLHGATLAQDAETVYTDGAAQLLVRVGEPSLDTFSLVYGEQDNSQRQRRNQERNVANTKA